MIGCFFFTWDGIVVIKLPLKKVVQKRNEFRMKAVLYLHDHPEVDHVLYYRDERNGDDKIWKAIFYEPGVRTLTDKEFLSFMCIEWEGMIGAVHRIE